ncbi:MAG: tripartite tricarboxylate transporter TctB family protein [Bacillota bacterium]|nr:tripartite tricarboxylate transporter TctB family protein [Bacillota bacterium]
MSEADEGAVRWPLFWVSVGSGIFGVVLGLVLLWGAFFDTKDVTPGIFGASPRDLPIVCGCVSLVAGAILLLDAWRAKAAYMSLQVPVASGGQPLRLLRSIAVVALVPLLIEVVGFYTAIITSLVLQQRLAGVRNWRVVLPSVLSVIAIIYVLLEVICRCGLPRGFLI